MLGYHQPRNQADSPLPRGLNICVPMFESTLAAQITYSLKVWKTLAKHRSQGATSLHTPSLYCYECLCRKVPNTSQLVRRRCLRPRRRTVDGVKLGLSLTTTDPNSITARWKSQVLEAVGLMEQAWTYVRDLDLDSTRATKLCGYFEVKLVARINQKRVKSRKQYDICWIYM